MNDESYLLDRHVREILAFDYKRRTGREYDGRRYGSVTGQNAPRMTQDWTECYGVDPRDVREGIERKKVCRKTLRYNYILREGRGRKCDVIVLHVAVRLNSYYQPVVKDVCAFYTRTGQCEWRDIDYCGVAGWIIGWEHKDIVGLKSEREKPYLLAKGKWYTRKEAWRYGAGVNFPYHETVNVDQLKGTRFEYCQYADTGTWKTGLIDWLMLYRQEPKVELLAKMGFYALISPLGLKALKDRVVFDWVREHAKEVRKRSADHWGPREIVYAAKHGISLKAAVRHFYFAKEMSHVIYGIRRAVYEVCAERFPEGVPAKMLPRLNYARLEKLVPKWHVECGEYGRYVEYAIRSGLDWKNEGTLYPPVKGGRKAFMARLEALEAEADRRRRKREREEKRKMKAAAEEKRKRLEKLFAERAVEIEAFQKSVERAKTLKGCGYRIVLAKTQEELRAEGKKMHNCVGMGHYGEGIVEGNTLIIMLKDASGKSYCDIQINRRDWSVVQCYLKRNERAPEEVRALARKLAEFFKAEYKRHKKRKAA